ncbi:MAG: hypothetical protein PHS88_06540 [Candidatus Omnitrophica bacterium]|nr:hypothetical protein [Candidatus Omnitrophota bacterium]
MAKNKKLKENSEKEKATRYREESLLLYNQVQELKKQLAKSATTLNQFQERLEDAEIYINLLTRFMITLCVEKLGMRIGVLKRLLKRVEKEAIKDSQVLHLESLFTESPEKKSPPTDKPAKKDPWEDIS